MIEEKAVHLARCKRRKQRGITLVELLVVLAILALISAIVVINVLPARDQAAVDKARIDIGVLETALDQYRLDMLNYPTTQQGLDALAAAPADARNATRYRPGGYLRGGAPLDPWGNPYQYRIPGERGGAYDLFSLGADGQPGGEGLNADIGNWAQEQ
ncbi:type II secretion system major pseudopilin GspG [Hyphococcus sp.]|uniref:type II secretion system major pseudopilin GspG n=1 Tax=Hyphococcus sp. TaxID=2038636 RepID=UPI003CCBF950